MASGLTSMSAPGERADGGGRGAGRVGRTRGVSGRPGLAGRSRGARSAATRTRRGVRRVRVAIAAAQRDRGRPAMAMERLVRSMIVTARAGGRGGEPLVREVADALHPWRLCRIALTERVPDDPTVRKPVTRLGPEVIEQIAMAVIAGAITAGANAAVGGAGREDRPDAHGVRHSRPDRSGPRPGRRPDPGRCGRPAIWPAWRVRGTRTRRPSRAGRPESPSAARTPVAAPGPPILPSAARI